MPAFASLIRRCSARATGATAAIVAMLAGAFPAAGQPAAGQPPDGKSALAAAPAPVAPDSKIVQAPRPGAWAAEKAHVERYDAAIAAVRGQSIAQADAERLKRAMARVAALDAAGAKAIREEIEEPTARKIVDWYRLRGGLGEAREYREFLAANPTWPSRELMVQRYEEALFTEGGPARVIKDAFKAQAPQTGAGHAALASAFLAEGDERGATRQARLAWREHTLGATLETGFLDRFGKLLTNEDHKWRLDSLLLDDPRWPSDRGDRAAMARRVAALLPEGERKKAEARIAVLLLQSNAPALLKALPALEKPDWGLVYHQVQALRRADKVEEAAQKLLGVPLDAASLVSPDGWWPERRTMMFALLRVGQPKRAYEVAKAAGPLSINPHKDQAFYAGWVALTQLKDAKLAEVHFGEMRRIADGPLSRAKAGYWHGRALEALGRKREAEVAWRESAQVTDTFHGQLSRAKLGGDSARLQITPPPPPTADQIKRFSGLDAARAAVIVRKAGLDVGLSRAFMGGLQRHLTTDAELAMVAHLAEALGDTQMAVRIAKAAVARGHNLLIFSYPLHAFPSFTALRQPAPEMALLLAIARQESEFNGLSRSGAGARGILQVMPTTARHVCRDYKIKCDIGRLMSDISYNTTLGAAYVGDRMRDFGGSYIMGFAGYNAGPGRVRQWLREFGDPRDRDVDPIDWVHRIPFEETREYVQKVLSNVQVYRARLGNGAARIAIAEDLMRARGESTGAGGNSGKAARRDADDEPRRAVE